MAAAVFLVIGWETLYLVPNVSLYLFFLASSLYLLTIAVAATRHQASPSPVTTPRYRFCCLIPAHNEALLIKEVIKGFITVERDGHQLDIVVIADNCNDDTAIIAEKAGARVIRRLDPSRRGKGYALEWAVKRLENEKAGYDAYIVMDADSFLSPNYLSVMARELAAGHTVIQCNYQVLNSLASWRTRLMTCALTLVHYTKPLGRSRLGLSDGLKGNGMCFTADILKEIPWSGSSITEDIDYTIRLCAAGKAVAFTPDAWVKAQMPATAMESASQRRRWESGRFSLMARHAMPMLRKGIRDRNGILVDRAIDLIIPPFSEMLAAPLIMAVANAILGIWLKITVAKWMAIIWGSVLLVQIVYLVIGLKVGKVQWPIWSALLFAPIYVVWKFALYLTIFLSKSVTGWQRTERRPLETKDPTL